MSEGPGVSRLWRVKADVTAFLGFFTLGYVVFHGLHVSGLSSGCHSPLEWAVMFGLIALLVRENVLMGGDGDD